MSISLSLICMRVYITHNLQWHDQISNQELIGGYATAIISQLETLLWTKVSLRTSYNLSTTYMFHLLSQTIASQVLYLPSIFNKIPLTTVLSHLSWSYYWWIPLIRCFIPISCLLWMDAHQGASNKWLSKPVSHIDRLTKSIWCINMPSSILMLKSMPCQGDHGMGLVSGSILLQGY